MLKHIVMWRFKDSAEGRTKLENMEYVSAMLRALIPVIPQIKSMEIGFDIGAGRDGFDMALVTEFENITALDEYQQHPRHKEVSAYVSLVRSERASVDYIV